MKNTFGNNVTLTLFGESHGPAVGAVLDGIPSGLPVSEDAIRAALSRRRPKDAAATTRREADEFSFLSGVYQGKTTGTPLCITIPNKDVNDADYAAIRGIARPGHGDYPAEMKYHGFQDARGGGHGSGRVTAALVAICAVMTAALEARGIVIASHLSSCAGVSDRRFDLRAIPAEKALLNDAGFPVLDGASGARMQAAVLAAKEDGDSVGGVIETAVHGLPAGVGEPWFDTVEGMLSHALFSIPAVKGVEFGDGFALAGMRGSEANDAYVLRDGRVATETCHGGGIVGGMTEGTPLLFRTAVKPTPSVSKQQNTVNFETMVPCTVSVPGRHDACVAPRAVPVVDAVTALVLCDLLIGRFGPDWLLGK